jgi:DNA-binding transcriptional regulator YiaG
MKEYMMDSGEFAKLLGTDVYNYSNWEHNRSQPKLEKAMIISNILNKPIESIWYLE